MIAKTQPSISPMIPKHSRTNTADPLYNYMQDVSKNLHSSSENNTILVPENMGHGFIKSFYIDEGFGIGYYHILLKDDLHFKWIREAGNKKEQIFKLIFRLKTNHCDENDHNYATENSTVLYSTDFERRGFIPQNKWYDAIGMIFTSSWLHENFSVASDKIYDIVKLLIQKNKPTFISELMEPAHYHIVRELSCEMSKEELTPIHIKTKSLLLVNDFLDKIVSRKSSELSSNQTLYHPEMQKVECRLSYFFDKPFPNLNTLAKEFNMSAVTLKRHFKIVYGKNIYQYYLEKKLAIGKEMIADKKKSISEIAYTLGYSKINSFSRVFKKYYGLLPKDVNAL